MGGTFYHGSEAAAGVSWQVVRKSAGGRFVAGVVIPKLWKSQCRGQAREWQEKTSECERGEGGQDTNTVVMEAR